MRTRRPFPDVEETDPEELGATPVEVAPALEASNAPPALGFIPHGSENRRTRRREVAKWTPPEGPNMPTRRELLKQRQRNARGKLDPQLRRLQRQKLRQKGRK